METFCEKKIQEKLTGEKLQGGCNNPPPPLGRLRVNELHFRCRTRLSALELPGPVEMSTFVFDLYVFYVIALLTK